MSRIGVAAAAIVVLAGLSLCLNTITRSDAAAKTSPEPIEQLCETIVTHACRGEKDASDLILKSVLSRPTSAWEGEQFDARGHNQMTQLADAVKQVGAYLGCELIEQKTVGNSVRVCVFVAKFERNTQRWTFVLYRPHDEWKILGVKYMWIMSELFPNP